MTNDDTSLSLTCHCCGGKFWPRTETGGFGPCCSGGKDYCINCLKCADHCKCGHRAFVTGYARAYRIGRTTPNGEPPG